MRALRITLRKGDNVGRTNSQTSKRMASVKQRGTTPELAVRNALYLQGFRIRTNVGTLPGKPDIVLAKHKTVVMVHGCFWHQHRNCSRATIPQANRKFWQEKLIANSIRDRLHAARLRRLRWRVLVVWECQLSPSRISQTTNRLSRRIKKSQLLLGVRKS